MLRHVVAFVFAANMLLVGAEQRVACKNECRKIHCVCFYACDEAYPGDYAKIDVCKEHCESQEEKCMKKCNQPVG